MKNSFWLPEEEKWIEDHRELIEDASGIISQDLSKELEDTFDMDPEKLIFSLAYILEGPDGFEIQIYNPGFDDFAYRICLLTKKGYVRGKLKDLFSWDSQFYEGLSKEQIEKDLVDDLRSIIVTSVVEKTTYQDKLLEVFNHCLEKGVKWR